MGFLNKEKVVRSIIIVKYQRPKLRNSNDIAITAVVMLGTGRGDIIDACSFNLNFQLVQTLKCLQKFQTAASVVVQFSTVHMQMQMPSYTGEYWSGFYEGNSGIRHGKEQTFGRCKLKITVHTVPRLKRAPSEQTRYVR